MSHKLLAGGRNYSFVVADEKESQTVVWRVTLDDPEEFGQAAIDDVGDDMPEFIGDMVLLNYSAESSSEDGLDWIVTANYGTPEEEENPLNERPKVSWSLAQFQENVEYDINGKPILNSAGEPYSEPVQIDQSRLVLTITRNEASFNPALALAYADAVSATTFKGAPAGKVKVANIASTEEEHKNVAGGVYSKTTYTFHFNSRGFQKKLLDHGFREKVEGKLKHILVQGQKITEAALLDGTGKQLPEGGQPKFKDWHVYPKLPFGIFNF